jgi:hypothetical protein
LELIAEIRVKIAIKSNVLQRFEVPETGLGRTFWSKKSQMTDADAVKKSIQETSDKIQSLRQQQADKALIDVEVKAMQSLQARLKALNVGAAVDGKPTSAKPAKNKMTVKTPKARSFCAQATNIRARRITRRQTWRSANPSFPQSLTFTAVMAPSRSTRPYLNSKYASRS